jgi:hypothetical protein
MKRLGVTLRLGAGVNTLNVDGREFDRLKLEKPERNKLRRMIVEAFRVKNAQEAEAAP